MPTGVSREAMRRARASRHAGRSETCMCGREVFGNGGKVSHYRTCQQYLAKHGWWFNEAEQEALRARAREATAHLPNVIERSHAAVKFLHDAAIAEARRRGLIPCCEYHPHTWSPCKPDHARREG